LKIDYTRSLLLLTAPVLSGALLVLAFPSFEIHGLIWIGFVPLMLTAATMRPLGAFLAAFTCGVIFYAGILGWLFEVGRYTWVHHILVVSYFSLYFGLFGLIGSWMSVRLSHAIMLFSMPFIWVSLEYLKSNLGFLAFPWPLISHSQYRVPEIIQIASITGAYGVSFLILCTNAAITGIVMRVLIRLGMNKRLGLKISKSWAAVLACWAALMIGVSVYYSLKVLGTPITGHPLKLAIVQGNIAQDRKWDPRLARQIIQTYATLTAEAAQSKPDLIIWPEAATPKAINMDRRVYNAVKQIVDTHGISLLTGSSSYEKFKTGQTIKQKFTNSAFLITPGKNQPMQHYDKIKLLPFGEYLPWKDRLPWSKIGVPRVAEYQPGKDYTVFDFKGVRFGVNICWEMGFPNIARHMVLNGASFMVNLTNMAWFGKSAAPYQMLSVSVFRAVENQVFMVRCANTGISCFIDPFGRVVDSVRNDANQELFVRGYLTGSVVPLTSKTFYTRRGDWLVWGCLFFSAGILAATLFLWVLRKSKRHHPQTI